MYFIFYFLSNNLTRPDDGLKTETFNQGKYFFN